MKKFILIFGLLVGFALNGHSQITPVKRVRIADRTTAFAQNLPAGTAITCVSDSTDWLVGSAGVASAATIATAWVAGTITLNITTVENSATRGDVNYPVVIDSTKATEQQLEILAATASYAGVMTAADKTKLDGITAGSGVAYVDYFEVSTGGDDKTETLSFSPLDSTGVIVSLNGQELSMVTPYDQWDINLTTKVVTFRIPVYAYDAVKISYSK